jgi:MFS family permease
MAVTAPPRRTLAWMRAAVWMLFASFGMVLATWAVHLPALQQRTGISTAALGTVLLILGVGSLAAMQLCGPLVDRIGSGTVAVFGGCAMAATVIVPLAGTTFWQAAAGAAVFGFAVGGADVAMNAAAVAIERDYGRPIMASFHAVFSVGNVVGSVLAAISYGAGIAVLPAVVMVVALCLAADGFAAYVLLRHRHPAIPQAESHTPQPTRDDAPRPSGRILIFGVLAFLLLLSEGAAMDWSSLHAEQHLGTSASVGALAFGAFVAAMTAGRFTVDRIAQRVGPVRVVRWGCVGAAAGLTLVVLSPALPLTLVGWVLFGLGLAGGVPQVFTAAGRVSSDASGRVLARVVGVGYVAILAGPAVIGWVAEWTSLSVAFLVPLGAVVVCGLAAGTLAPTRDSARPRRRR